MKLRSAWWAAMVVAVTGLVWPFVMPSKGQRLGFGYTSTAKLPFIGPTTNADSQFTQKYGESFYTMTSVDPDTSGLSGPQPTMFQLIALNSTNTMKNAGHSMFVMTNGGARSNDGVGWEGDCFMRGASTSPNCIGDSGYAEIDSGTLTGLYAGAFGGVGITGGTVTEATSVLAGAPTKTGGTVNFVSGVHINDQGGIGAIGNFGLWVHSQTGAGARLICAGCTDSANAGIVDFANASYILHPPLALASAPSAPVAGESFYCTNCTTAATCTTAGSGHMAVYNGAAWTCQ